MEINENRQEQANNNAMMEVNSSITLEVALLVRCNEVITKRQNPRRLADVGKICWDVLLAISSMAKVLGLKHSTAGSPVKEIPIYKPFVKALTSTLQ